MGEKVGMQCGVPPVGSFSAGNISPDHMFHSEAAVTRPAKPRNRVRESAADIAKVE
jgi:hypothetical protein